MYALRKQSKLTYFAISILLLFSNEVCLAKGFPILIEGNLGSCSGTLAPLTAVGEKLQRAIHCYDQLSRVASEQVIPVLDRFTAEIQEVEGESVHSETLAVASLFQGLYFCQKMSIALCDQVGCFNAPTPGTRMDEIKASLFCSARRAAWNTFLNTDWDSLFLYPIIPEGISDEKRKHLVATFFEKKKGYFKDYDSCVQSFLSEGLDAVCQLEDKIPKDPHELEKLVQTKVSATTRGLFEDIASPFYAMFSNKLKVGESFTANSEQQIKAVASEKGRLESIQANLRSSFEIVKEPLNKIFQDYLQVSERIIRLRTSVEQFVSNLIDPVLNNRIEMKTSQIAHLENEMKLELAELEALDPQKRVDQAIQLGTQFCKMYYCFYWGLSKQFTNFENACTLPNWKNESLCKGTFVENGNEIKVQDYCLQISPENKDLWSPNIRDNPTKVRACLTSF